jgi:hypothetical protein
VSRKQILRFSVAVAAATLTSLSMSSTAMAAKGGRPKPPAPVVRDSDHDGMPDRWETANGLNPHRNDAAADADRDKLSNRAEHTAGTSPRRADSDRDGMPDGWEVSNHLNPLRDDAAADPDSDGLTNVEELKLRDNPRQADSDHDGTHDGAEDSDGDGVSDEDETRVGDNPKDADSDHDGTPDGREQNGTITAVDAGTGALSLTTAAGFTVTVIVTGHTEITWQHRSRGCADPASIADLTPGRLVHKVETGDHHNDGDGDHQPPATGTNTDKISLVCA